MLLLTFSLSACDRFTERRDENVVAELGTEKLYRSNLEAVVAAAADSAEAANLEEAYIRQWATDILFYEKAHATNDPEIEALVETYRRSLYLHRYEQQLIQNRMPRVVTPEAIQSYYDENIAFFTLHEDILKGVLIVLPLGAPHPEKVDKWLLNLDENIEKVEKYAYKYATGYQLFTDEWTSGNQVMIRMPFEGDNLSQRMRASDFIEMKDSVAIYKLLITDKRFVGDPMPLEYATPLIKEAILQKRQVDFLRAQRDELYEDALDGKLKIYKENMP